MDNLDDYDESLADHFKTIDRLFKKSKTANEGDKLSFLSQIKKSLRAAREDLVFYKQELFNIPKGTKKDIEDSYRSKYSSYQEKVTNYERETKRLELTIRGDEVGLL